MDRINDCPDMTSAVYNGHKASAQANKNLNKNVLEKIMMCVIFKCSEFYLSPLKMAYPDRILTDAGDYIPISTYFP